MKSRSDTLSGWLFLAPFLVVYFIFLIYPVFQAAYMSLFDWDLLAMWDRSMVGFRNYVEMFTSDRVFWVSLGNTLKFVVYSTPLIIFIGLLLAVLINHQGSGFFRALFFSPYIFSVAVVTLMWGFLLNPQQGLIAVFLGWFGVEPIAWLTNPRLALPAIVVTTLWWTMGFNMVLFLAGLQDISPSLYEAAGIDGTNSIQKFFHITIPGLRRTMLLVAVLQVIASFQIFGQVYIMTRGGPAGTTRVLIQYIYESGFRDYRLGYASAMSVLLFLLMFIVSYFQFKLSPEED
ncbi:MAG: carbohydrate ABC transporter permease [Sediminispirochaetaceae bacterium]